MTEPSFAAQRQADVAEAAERSTHWPSDQIDADFALMAQDHDYRVEAELICKEFAIADWEAFKLGEAKPQAHSKLPNG